MIHFVVGTKAQLIKTAPVMVELKKRKIPFNFIFTGQHQETISNLRKIFNLKNPDVVLYHGPDITSIPKMITWSIKILAKTILHKKQIFRNDRSGIVLVHGDTFSTFLGAAMAKIAKLKVGHLESGLRSFNLWHPFPEELTRLLVFRMSNVFFCPDNWSYKNLKKYRGIKINTHGNTLLDALRLALKNEHHIKVDIPKEKFAIVSTHRFENIFNRNSFEKVIEIIEKASLKIKVLVILHPPTKKNLKKFGFWSRLAKNENIELRPRYDYFQFIKLLDHAEFIMTDGGSNQEECYYLGKPCLLLRKATERKEGLGKNVVLSKYKIRLINYFLDNYQQLKFKPKNIPANPSQIIVDYLKNNFLIEKISGREYSQQYFNNALNKKNKSAKHYLNKIKNVMEMILPISTDEKILDIGTANGTFAFECARYSAKVIGTDLSKIAIYNCINEAKKRKISNIKFIQCPAHKQPFADQKFDKIILADLVEHLTKHTFRQTLKECGRLLKKDGKLIIYTPNKKHLFEKMRKKNLLLKEDPTHVNVMSPGDLKKELLKLNFIINKLFYKSSHFPVFSTLEKLMMKIPYFKPFFQRRICLIAEKS